MANTHFSFKEFTVNQDRCAMKVTTDACLFGAWISRSLEALGSQQGSVLDIGTGTGILPLMIAQQHPQLQFTAVDIDQDAAEQAHENSQRSPWSNRIAVQAMDIRNYVTLHSFDVIVSNPPFYQDELRSPNEKKNKAHHDSSLLLPALVEQIANLLIEQGLYYLMIPYKRKQELFKLLAAKNLPIEKTVLVKPTAEKDFFRVFIQGRKTNSEKMLPEEMEIVISPESGTYSTAFSSLLKDYYLYL